MYDINNINAFLVKWTGKKKVKETDDIDYDLGCTGDDFHELIDSYGKTFNVDMSQYLWYFHTQEEGNNIGGLFFKPPNLRVKHIPVTPQLLLENANKGKWDVNYPEHKLPEKRYDLIINKVLFYVVVVFILYFLIIKYII
jgi:hypothetical protein